jgi:hypothetical protein
MVNNLFMKNSIFRYEYFKNNEWIEYDPEKLRLMSLPYYSSLIHRITRTINENKIAEEYRYLAAKAHRLDAPAKQCIFPFENSWHINGVWLKYFESYIKDSKQGIFEYIQRYPKYIKEVELICRYNNWLAEKELLLLTAIDLFKDK